MGHHGSSAAESATENADELLRDLRISYNKARQEAITNEIIEIDKEDIIRVACQHRAAVLSNARVKNAIVTRSKNNQLEVLEQL